MRANNGQQVPLIMSPEQRAFMQQQEAIQQLRQVISFRNTCAMNNLGSIIATYSEPMNASIDSVANCKRAKQMAEELCVELSMVPSVQFFRDLEAQAKQEDEANKPNIVTE